VAVKRGPLGTLTKAVGAPKPGSWQYKAAVKIMSLNVPVFRLTKGRIGGTMDGVPVLLLHHVGRKSGEHRVTATLHFVDGDNIAIIASMGGSPKHPAWFHNLKANPDTTVELRSGRREVRARVATGDERARLWEKAVAAYPTFTDYQARSRGREIPVVVLEPR
jgi:deazaflavin-dependent oxidoreductase (nitroreductase family)